MFSCSLVNIVSANGSGCRLGAHSSNASSSIGDCAKSPSRLLAETSSAGNETNAAPDVSCTSPHESSAIVSPTSKMRVHDGSDVFIDTAARTMHDTLTLPPPQSHWYVCTANGRPSYTPLIRLNTPTPWNE